MEAPLVKRWVRDIYLHRVISGAFLFWKKGDEIGMEGDLQLSFDFDHLATSSSLSLKGSNDNEQFLDVIMT